jgi:ABC-type spermidine/putrescine transport system permease subunit I
MEARVTSDSLSTSRVRPRGGIRRRAATRWLWLIAPAILFLAIFYLWPVLTIAIRSLTEPDGFSLTNYRRFFESEAFLRVMLNTIRTAAVVTVVTLVIGYPYTYLMRVSSRRVAAILLFAVLLPFWSSLLVRTYAWTVLLRDSGILNAILLNLQVIAEPLEIIRTPLAVQIGLSHVLLPFMVLPLYAVMSRIEPDYDLAARSLGANAFTSFRRVFLPMSLPGVMAGSLLVFVLATGYFITPALLGGPRDQMLGELIVNQVSQQLDWGMGSAMAVLLTALTLGVLGIAASVIRLPDMFGASAGE